MNTQLSTKLAALAVALMMNSLIVGGVALIFNNSLPHQSAALSVAHAASTVLRVAV
jgi:hypothetical protein